MIALHFGAGNIGRGFIGALLTKSGYDVVFADVNEAVINELNEKRRYPVELADLSRQTETIGPVQAINSGKQPEELYEWIAKADLVTTAVGPSVLKLIAGSVAEGLKRRLSKNKKPLNIVACENMIGGSDHLKEAIFSYLTEEEQKALSRLVGFPNSAVDRIVPVQQHDDPLKVSVEPFFEWVVDKTAFAGEVPDIEGVTYVSDLAPYIERKLFTVNTGHAIAAYAGYQKGFQTIRDAVCDPEVRETLAGALEETGQYLIQTYGFSEEEHQSYIKKIIGRFENEFISDDITRVARSPLRKLGEHDRLIRPARKLSSLNVKPVHLAEGIARALQFDFADDPEAVQLQSMIREKGYRGVLGEVCGLAAEDPLVPLILKHVEK
ncbi:MULTISPECIES: mannitol-1-phosphate 5-dehydrogenase [Bacillus]|uniref:Mannitol-1-phosphate 5-dehydrogenase n=1 Tax=Bacillus glycinifermentans TaxID=1664069 RepID=A0AAJ4D127_9BACI|nr:MULTISPECIES: mannitol-1-phosphate 5-dehydrogenase [Bacillus]KKB74323.1 mannitol-1-phosphate 5-dehydrogenase [Bacillus sp. TH008]MDU0073207.1 mannitol-1-phosphate 5-dehydrogenase [Bacillus sp. IG6]MED8021044.1 mannitol-1-phosphate 5-dehydrogenase [Bacillus glycinifermentans]QAT63960.1 mannitol-1-phosphate 5-dehydrogenase [Bacillus glycinifermentans]WKB77841.1 mannitol-1-phosphate 5-dehydrogenase [Bacillus glycinifermentans]